MKPPPLPPIPLTNYSAKKDWERKKHYGAKQTSPTTFTCQCKNKTCWMLDTVHYIKHPHQCLRCSTPQPCTNCPRCHAIDKLDLANNKRRAYLGLAPHIYTGTTHERKLVKLKPQQIARKVV